MLVENFKTGRLQRYGLDYDTLKAQNPRLIYCSITGFGQTGPYARAMTCWCSGNERLMSITGRSDSEPGGGPVRVGVAVIDLFTGMYATTAILSALEARHHTGRGQHRHGPARRGDGHLGNQGADFSTAAASPDGWATAARAWCRTRIFRPATAACCWPSATDSSQLLAAGGLGGEQNSRPTMRASHTARS